MKKWMIITAIVLFGVLGGIFITVWIIQNNKKDILEID